MESSCQCVSIDIVLSTVEMLLYAQCHNSHHSPLPYMRVCVCVCVCVLGMCVHVCVYLWGVNGMYNAANDNPQTLQIHTQTQTHRHTNTHIQIHKHTAHKPDSLFTAVAQNTTAVLVVCTTCSTSADELWDKDLVGETDVGDGISSFSPALMLVSPNRTILWWSWTVNSGENENTLILYDYTKLQI